MNVSESKRRVLLSGLAAREVGDVVERVGCLHMRVICLIWRWQTRDSTNPCHTRTMGGYVCPLSSTASALRQSVLLAHWRCLMLGRHAIDKARLLGKRNKENTQKTICSWAWGARNGIRHADATFDLVDQVPVQNDSPPFVKTARLPSWCC